MIRIYILAGLIGIGFSLPAFAQERHEWVGGRGTSWVEIGPPEAPGAVASITFYDDYVHTISGETFALVQDGLTVTVRVKLFPGDPGEELHLTPQEGYFAWPEVLKPGEWETGVAHIYPIGLGS